MKKNRPLIIVLTIIIITLAIFTIGKNIIIDMYTPITHETTFTKEGWIKKPYERRYMIDDLRKKYNMIGLKKQDVIDLLGEPSHIENKNSNIVFSYLLGNTVADPITLDIIINNENIVVDYYAGQH